MAVKWKKKCFYLLRFVFWNTCTLFKCNSKSTCSSTHPECLWGLMFPPWCWVSDSPQVLYQHRQHKRSFISSFFLVLCLFFFFLSIINTHSWSVMHKDVLSRPKNNMYAYDKHNGGFKCGPTAVECLLRERRDRKKKKKRGPFPSAQRQFRAGAFYVQYTHHVCSHDKNHWVKTHMTEH